jgi:subtilisin family serine protease
MHRTLDQKRFLFAGAELPPPQRAAEPNEPAFGSGDKLWPLDLIDPRFERDPLFDEEPDPRGEGRKRRARKNLAPLALALCALGGAGCGRQATPLHTGDAILVQLKPGAVAPSHVLSDDGNGPPVVPLLDLSGDDDSSLLRLPLPPGLSAEEFARRAAEDDAVEFAEPIHLYRPSKSPDDPRFKDLWGLSRVDAPAAWDKTTGDRKVVVAVVDDGVALNHADIAPNLWVNPDEIEDNGQDDDGDGYVDDVHGYDFVDDDGDPSPATSGDVRWHGTHVSGTIGAVGDNGVGVVGVNWQVSIMALRALGPDGGRADALARAINYATDHGARVINASWGGGGTSQTLSKAIARAGKRGVLFAVAAGNDGAKKPEYPANLALDNVLSVGATAPNDALADFSNQGALVAAPGVGILSTTSPGRYERYDGTSMATPHVAGIAALLWSKHPDATLRQVRDAILASGQETAGVEHGRVSAARALATLEGSSGGAGSLHLSRTSLAFAATGDRAPRTQVISLRAEDGGTIGWTAKADASWIDLPRPKGETPSRLSVRVDPKGLRAGSHEAKVVITSVGKDGAREAATLSVTLTVGASAAVASAAGPSCAVQDGRVHVRAGAICRVTAPGIDPAARAVGLSWRLPGGERVQGGSLAARFVRKGTFSLRLSAQEGSDEEVPIVVE